MTTTIPPTSDNLARYLARSLGGYDHANGWHVRATVDGTDLAVTVTTHDADEVTFRVTTNDLLAEVDSRLRFEDVERFLKRERDEYEPGGECWNTVDDVLDCFRLHMVTGTPLTDPRPEEGPRDPSVGSPPLTEAEELRAEVDRLKAQVQLMGAYLQRESLDAIDKALAEREASAR
jgi:hypothetical protein